MADRQSFRDVQQRQRRRSYILLVGLGLSYILLAVLLIFPIKILFAGFGSEGESVNYAYPERQQEQSPAVDNPLLFTTAEILFIVSIATLAVLVQLVYARAHAVPAIERALGTQPPDSDDRYHRRFANTVEEMAVAAGYGGQVRPVVMPSATLNAFAAEDVRHGILVGATEALIAELPRDQLQAVVAHEVAHIRHGDARLSAFVCALQAPIIALSEFLDSLGDNTEDGPLVTLELARGPERLPREGGALGGVLLGGMRLLSLTFSRRRELLADAGAVELTRNPQALAEALKRIAGGSHYLGAQAGAFSPIFINDVAASSLSEKKGFLSDLFSTHPPMRERLAALAAMGAAAPDPQRIQRAAYGQTLHREARWQVQRDGQWGEPMTLSEILALGSIGPASLVWREGAAAAAPAGQDPLLATNLGIPTPPAPDATESPAAPPDPADGQCPNCAAPLLRREYEGVDIRACAACAGHLVADNRVRRILKRSEMQFSEEYRQRAFQWQEENNVRKGGGDELPPDNGRPPRHCPDCQAPLTRRYFDYQYLVPVERCFACQTIWFDRDELEFLQILHEKNRKGSGA